MEWPTTREQVIDWTHSEHDMLEQVVNSLTPEQLVAPILDDGWSVKDVLAHIAEWEKLMLGWIEAYLRGGAPVRFAPDFVPTPDTFQETADRLNQALYEQNRARSLQDVCEDYAATYERVLALLGRLSQQDMFGPNRFPAREGTPLAPTIGGNTFGHYREHREWIQTALGKSAD